MPSKHIYFFNSYKTISLFNRRRWTNFIQELDLIFERYSDILEEEKNQEYLIKLQQFFFPSGSPSPIESELEDHSEGAAAGNQAKLPMLGEMSVCLAVQEFSEPSLMKQKILGSYLIDAKRQNKSIDECTKQILDAYRMDKRHLKLIKPLISMLMSKLSYNRIHIGGKYYFVLDVKPKKTVAKRKSSNPQGHSSKGSSKKQKVEKNPIHDEVFVSGPAHVQNGPVSEGHLGMKDVVVVSLAPTLSDFNKLAFSEIQKRLVDLIATSSFDKKELKDIEKQGTGAWRKRMVIDKSAIISRHHNQNVVVLAPSEHHEGRFDGFYGQIKCEGETFYISHGIDEQSSGYDYVMHDSVLLLSVREFSKALKWKTVNIAKGNR